GWKKERHDPLAKTIPSKFFNRVTRWVSGIKLHDFNCGLKAYDKKVIKAISIQGEMHRYIPVIAKRAGFTNIGEKIVQHRAREHGVTKFGLERFANGFLDLLTVTFVSKFGNRPMHFFGFWGAFSFFFGFIAAAILGVKKLIAMSKQQYGDLVTDSPYFFIALTLMIIGVQLFLAGYLGELITRQKEPNEYLMIEKELG
ncbi:MAG: glycosyltransferase, partial [Saprospiraceae bacterium]|nr:glycosyltransferase [Saprospiraceae bacterium]